MGIYKSQVSTCISITVLLTLRFTIEMARVTFSFFALLCAVALSEGRVTQWFTFHEQVGCEGDFRNVTDTTLNIPGGGDELIANRTISWISQGLWISTFTDGTFQGMVNRYDWLFCTWNQDESISHFQSVEKPHSYDFDESAFLASEDWFYGEPRYTVTPDVDRMTFNPPLQISTWLFTGNQSFVLYEKEGGNNNGTILCLEPDPYTKERGYGIEFNDNIPFPVEVIERVPTCPENSARLMSERKRQMSRSPPQDGNNVKLSSELCPVFSTSE